MKRLVREKEKAINLRKKGLSYNEILKEVPVAKSSLSLWLKDLPLTQSEKQFLKSSVDRNMTRGRIKAASELQRRRLQRENEWVKIAKELFAKYSDEPLFHAGITMYWAEGAKTSTRWMLINTDLEVIRLMVSWLRRYPEVSVDEIHFRLYIHRPYGDGRCESWWQSELNVSSDKFLKTIYKETKHKSKLKAGHHGCLRVEVDKSKQLLFTMKILKNLAVEYYQKQ